MEAEKVDKQTLAAITMALHLYMTDEVHDTEPFVITIRRKQSFWDDRSRNFRKKPV
ncbi:MAG: hypothetical protein MJY83_00355 [Bacteroidales bacterium]|nr:hypothetical protein [Bacteroidales bacterium]